MNKALEDLYRVRWNDLIEHSGNINAAYPLLIKVNADYQSADLRVMIVGQETDGWIGQLHSNDKSVAEIQEEYFKYLYSNKDKIRRPFWNRKNFRYYREQLSKRYPNKKIELIWNNVHKIGKTSRGKPTAGIMELEKRYFQVFGSELDILSPDIIIFLTGDRRIPARHLEIHTVHKEPVCQVALTDYPDIFAVRTYHPNAKIKGGKKQFKEQVLNLVCNHITSAGKGRS